jgi:hypothetical protein
MKIGRVFFVCHYSAGSGVVGVRIRTFAFGF